MTIEEAFTVIKARHPAGLVKKPAEIEEKIPMDSPENIADKLKLLTVMMGGKLEATNG